MEIKEAAEDLKRFADVSINGIKLRHEVIDFVIRILENLTEEKIANLIISSIESQPCCLIETYKNSGKIGNLAKSILQSIKEVS